MSSQTVQQLLRWPLPSQFESLLLSALSGEHLQVLHSVMVCQGSFMVANVYQTCCEWLHPWTNPDVNVHFATFSNSRKCLPLIGIGALVLLGSVCHLATFGAAYLGWAEGFLALPCHIVGRPFSLYCVSVKEQAVVKFALFPSLTRLSTLFFAHKSWQLWWERSCSVKQQTKFTSRSCLESTASRAIALWNLVHLI